MYTDTVEKEIEFISSLWSSHDTNTLPQINPELTELFAVIPQIYERRHQSHDSRYDQHIRIRRAYRIESRKHALRRIDNARQFRDDRHDRTDSGNDFSDYNQHRTNSRSHKRNRDNDLSCTLIHRIEPGVSIEGSVRGGCDQEGR